MILNNRALKMFRSIEDTSFIQLCFVTKMYFQDSKTTYGTLKLITLVISNFLLLLEAGYYPLFLLSKVAKNYKLPACILTVTFCEPPRSCCQSQRNPSLKIIVVMIVGITCRMSGRNIPSILASILYWSQFKDIKL